MNEQNIVALFDTAAHAEAAVRDLKAANVPDSAITQHARSASTSSVETTGSAAPAQPQGFWASLFGGGESEPASDHYASVYDRSVESGSTIVMARVPEHDVDRISTILEKHNPIDLDERAAQYGASETTTTRTTTTPMSGTGTPATALGGRATPAATDRSATAATATDGGTMQLSEETLSVGKRAVSGGTTRIRRFVVETPVEEQVTLHTEKVTMERHPVTDGGRVGAGDFTDKAIEMTETSEEAVVAKTARVKEEISLRKESTERVETIKDTVRREDVKIEQVPGNQTTRATEDTSAVPPSAACIEDLNRFKRSGAPVGAPDLRQEEALSTSNYNPQKPRSTSPGVTTVDTTTALGGGSHLHRRISWGAVLAGVVVVVAIQLLLSLLGAGIGLGTVNTTASSTPAAGNLGIGAGVWWVVSSCIALFAGGYIAAWLAGIEIRFDGMLHGLVTWGIATLLTFWLLTSAVGGIIGGGFSALGSVASAAGSGVSEAAKPIAQATGVSPDMIAQQAQSYLQPTNSDPATMSPQDAQKQVASNLVTYAKGGTDAAAAKERVINIMAAQMKISHDDAAKQFNDNQAKLKQAKDQAIQSAKTAADDSAAAVSTASFAGFGVLLLGLIVAAIGGSLAVQRRMQVTHRTVNDRV